MHIIYCLVFANKTLQIWTSFLYRTLIGMFYCDDVSTVRWGSDVNKHIAGLSFTLIIFTFHRYHSYIIVQQYIETTISAYSHCKIRFISRNPKIKKTLENTEGAIKNGQSRETGNTRHRTKTQTKQKHSTIYIGHHYTKTNTNNVNKAWNLLPTTGDKDEPNMRKS